MKIIILLCFLLSSCSKPILKYRDGDTVHIDLCKLEKYRQQHAFYKCKLHGNIINVKIGVDKIYYEVEFECQNKMLYVWTELY